MDSVSVRAIESKQSEDSFHKFAEENHKFILKCAYQTCHRFVSESDDEWSIALIAFYEAVKNYDESKGAFRGFASMVIKRRLMDYFDSESKHKNEIATEPVTFDGDIDVETATPYEIEVAKTSTDVAAQIPGPDNPLRDEIRALQQILGRYGFPLYDLGGCSPKAGRTKRGCAAAIDALLESEELKERMRRTGNLPYTELLKVKRVTKKILERHRKYIITAVEILSGDFPQLSEYMSNYATA